MHLNPPILTAQGLCFRHAHPPGPLLFDRLQLALPPGVTFVGGDESSGKTTLLQLLAGDLAASEAGAELRIAGISLAQDRQAYRQQVAWLDPRDTAFDQHTARQVFAAMAPRHTGWNADALQVHIDGLSLAPHLDKALYMMSSGTRRKVLLAAAMAAQAPVTLLDQPFMALDRPSINYLIGVLNGASSQARQAWVVADYEAPEGVALAAVVRLGG